MSQVDWLSQLLILLGILLSESNLEISIGQA